MRFRDRADAGQQLAQLLIQYAERDDVVVYALPRGGIVIAAEVAQVLKVPLDVIVTRKVGHPLQPEYAIAAVGAHTLLYSSDEEIASVDDSWFEQEVRRQRLEIARRRERYAGDHAPVSPTGKTVILVDNGVATGLTLRAAIAELRHEHPARIIVAVPVVAASTAHLIEKEADQLITVTTPSDAEFLGAVGSYYEDFEQVTDEEVIALLA